MRTLALLFTVVFAVVVTWRNVVTKKRDRKKVRFAVRELALAAGVSAVVATALFFSLFNNTMRIV